MHLLKSVNLHVRGSAALSLLLVLGQPGRRGTPTVGVVSVNTGLCLSTRDPQRCVTRLFADVLCGCRAGVTPAAAGVASVCPASAGARSAAPSL